MFGLDRYFPHGDDIKCSFCGKRQKEVKKIIANPHDRPRAYICDECVETYDSILQEELGAGKGETSK